MAEREGFVADAGRSFIETGRQGADLEKAEERGGQGNQSQADRHPEPTQPSEGRIDVFCFCHQENTTFLYII
jgi:hypothetical protein